jgi:MDMPI C-terminal domain
VMTEYPADGTDTPVSEVTMPAEALVRLAYGRLDPAHTPASVTGSESDLATLRSIFPGF